MAKFSRQKMLKFKQNDIPVYRQLVANVRAGFLALDNDIQSEIKCFIEKQQQANGAFTDRAGKPDLYYSLFGLWLSMATEQSGQLSALKSFVSTQNDIQPKSIIEELALTLVKIELDSGTKITSAISIIWKIVRKGRMIDLSYQFFLIALVIDAGGKNKRSVYFFFRIWLLFYKVKENIPCSLISALLYARKIFGLKTSKLQKKLISFSVESGGFRAFNSIYTADSLSTGVALFVLNETEYDLRLIKPGCLGFIQENYCEGAFLSGDGDKSKDLEYTFYGLLALGSVVNETKK